MMMQSPKTDDPSVSPRCSESRGGVVIDGLVTTLYGLAGLAILSEGSESAASLPFLGLGVAHTASAIAGNGAAKRCTKAHQAHNEWLAGARIQDDASRRRLIETKSDSVGKRGERCYGNLTCNRGLTCEPRTRICVVGAPSAAAGASSSQEAASKPKPTPLNNGADGSSQGSPAGPPAGPPDGARGSPDELPEELRGDPPPSVDDINWSDFWREVNL